MDQDPFACQETTGTLHVSNIHVYLYSICLKLHVLTFLLRTEFDGCPYGVDVEWSIEWSNTDRDTTATQPCPGELDSVSGIN